MAKLIKHRKIAHDAWRTLEPGGDGKLAAEAPRGDIIVPLDYWLREREALAKHEGKVGLCLQGNAEPAPLANDLARFHLIAVHFPTFVDGRGFSLARLLRERYGYKAELRAVGDVLVDQLLLLERCGFDSFELRADQNVDAALAAFGAFSDAYQPTVPQPLPLFRRRGV
jgi:uncharacterized protein (DUF934 family)